MNNDTTSNPLKQLGVDGVRAYNNKILKQNKTKQNKSKYYLKVKSQDGKQMPMMAAAFPLCVATERC